VIALVLLLALLCACDSGEGGGNNSDSVGNNSDGGGNNADGDEKPIPQIGSVGLAYEVNDDGVSCTIVGIGSCHDTEIIIPTVIDGYAVTSIGYAAFEGCTGLTSITLPFAGASRDATGYESHFGYIFGYSSSSSSSGGYHYEGSNRYYTYYIPASLRQVVITGGSSASSLFPRR